LSRTEVWINFIGSISINKKFLIRREKETVINIWIIYFKDIRLYHKKVRTSKLYVKYSDYKLSKLENKNFVDRNNILVPLGDNSDWKCQYLRFYGDQNISTVINKKYLLVYLHITWVCKWMYILLPFTYSFFGGFMKLWNHYQLFYNSLDITYLYYSFEIIFLSIYWIIVHHEILIEGYFEYKYCTNFRFIEQDFSHLLMIKGQKLVSRSKSRELNRCLLWK
jgi:hypothetical protein